MLICFHQLADLGFHGYALDFISAPDAVRAYLRSAGLHQAVSGLTSIATGTTANASATGRVDTKSEYRGSNTAGHRPICASRRSGTLGDTSQKVELRKSSRSIDD